MVIEIPDNATNGDVMIAVYGVKILNEDNKYIDVELDDKAFKYLKTWWYLPYEK